MVSSAPFPIGNTAGRHHAVVRQSSPIISLLMSMDYFWVAAVWLHLLAAVMWIGGMLFLSVVFAPLVRNGNVNPMFPAVFRAAAQRFRRVVWTAMAVLVMTGLVLVHQRGVSLVDLAHWPKVLQMKIGLVGVLYLDLCAQSPVQVSRRSDQGLVRLYKDYESTSPPPNLLPASSTRTACRARSARDSGGAGTLLPGSWLLPSATAILATL